MKNIFRPLFIIGAIALASCSTAKEQLGLNRHVPDEFAVVKRAPLAMPPDFNALPKPQPGAPRPQEQSAAIQAQEAIFGNAPAAQGQTEGEALLLQKAGAANVDPNIRRKVDAETTQLAKENVPVAKKIFGLGGDPAIAPSSIVNAKAEAARLEKNKESGKPVTAGETPTLEK